MKIQFTDHVKYRILERGIDVSQIKTVLKNPDSNKFAFNNKMKATKIEWQNTGGCLYKESRSHHCNNLLYMKIQYDKIADAMYIYLKKGKVSKTIKSERPSVC